MPRPKKDEKDIRVRIDVTISKDELAKLEEISRITGIPKSGIVSKMIREESLEEAMQYRRQLTALERSPYATSDNRHLENQSFEPEDGQEPEESNNQDLEEDYSLIPRAMKEAAQKWGFRQ